MGMQEEYRYYVAMYNRPGVPMMSFEEFVEGRDQLKVTKDQATRDAEAITDYREFVERTLDLKSRATNEFEAEDVAYRVAKEMKNAHDRVCRTLHQEGGQEALIGAHIAAYTAARKQILPPVKKGPRHQVVAVNVYDDDDHPTTHYL